MSATQTIVPAPERTLISAFLQMRRTGETWIARKMHLDEFASYCRQCLIRLDSINIAHENIPSLGGSRIR